MTSCEMFPTPLAKTFLEKKSEWKIIKVETCHAKRSSSAMQAGILARPAPPQVRVLRVIQSKCGGVECRMN